MIFNISNRGLSPKLASLSTAFIIILSAVGTPVSLNGQPENNYPLGEEATDEPLGNEAQTTELSAEICDNSLDDDGDGSIDSDDEDCPAQTQEPDSRPSTEEQQHTEEQKPAIETSCDNGFDDDGDGMVDAQDGDCSSASPEEQTPSQPEQQPEQQGQQTTEQPPEEVPPTEPLISVEVCDNGVDDDADALVDTQDITDCPSVTPNVQSPQEQPKEVSPTIQPCPENQTGCTPSAEPKLMPPIVTQCPENQTGCTPSAEPKLMPPLVTQCPENQTGCTPSVTESNPKTTECVNQTSANQDCTVRSEEKPAEVSDCPNNMIITHCLPPADVSLTDFQQNSAPIANAGEDQEANENSIVTLDGTKSHDDDGNITSYSWVQTGGNESVTITDADSPTPSFYVPHISSDSSLKFELTVFDDMGYGTSDEMNVLVKNVDDFRPLPLNGSITLDPVPSVLAEGLIYVFKGELSITGRPDFEGRYVQIIDATNESQDILSFGAIDKNGVFVAEWTTQPRDTDYNIHALYEDGNGTSLTSESYKLTVEPTQLRIENLTSNNIRDPYIPIQFNDYRNDELNVYVAWDEKSVHHLHDAKKAIQMWSQVLKDRSGNRKAWNFKFSDSRGFPNLNAEQFRLHPINILVNLKFQYDDKLCKENKNGKDYYTYGVAHTPFVFRVFRSTISANVYTGCGSITWPSAVVYSTTLHEFGHELGLGHAWKEKGDLMCSTDFLQRDRLDRILSEIPILNILFLKRVDTCDNSIDHYLDTNEPSEFDVGAVIYAYGKDGFALPNRQIFLDTNYTCSFEPKLCQPASRYHTIGKLDKGNLAINENKDLPIISKKSETISEEQTLSSTLQSYYNSKFGISLQHPTDWKVANLKNGIQLIKEKNGVYVEIRKHNLESPDMLLKKYVSDDIKDRSSSREDFKLLNITKTTISGNLPAYKAIYTFLKTENQKDFTAEGMTNKILRIWTFAQKSAYMVTYVADKDKYDLYLPIAEKIIDSLKINTQEKSPQDYDECASNGNVAPCIGDNGGIVYYCNDPRWKEAGHGAECMPSPQDWAKFLPSCDSVNYESSCSAPQGPYFTCDDPEFHIEKYPYGCLENGKLKTGR